MNRLRVVVISPLLLTLFATTASAECRVGAVGAQGQRPWFASDRSVLRGRGVRLTKGMVNKRKRDSQRDRRTGRESGESTSSASPTLWTRESEQASQEESRPETRRRDVGSFGCVRRSASRSEATIALNVARGAFDRHRRPARAEGRPAVRAAVIATPDPVIVINAYRQYYGAYHNHKEWLAYSAAVLFLGGASALVFRKDFLPDVKLVPIWCFSSRLLIGIVLLLTAIAAAFFVRFQFRGRERAADIVAGCNEVDLLGIGAGGLRASGRYRDRTRFGSRLPVVLDRAALRTYRHRRCFEGPRRSEYATYFLMVLWSLMVFWRFLS